MTFVAMDKDRIIFEIKKRKGELRMRGVKRIGLFGSYLEGTQKRGSDIDLLVEFRGVLTRDYFDVWLYLENVFKRKVDLVVEKDLRKELAYVKGEALYVTI
jgi:uncharacterized protein